MKKNNHWLSAICFFVATSVPALAGTIGEEALVTTAPPNNDPELSWSGLYLGGQLGGAWATQQLQYTNTNYFNTLGSTLLGRRFHFDPESFIGGGYLGFNFQTLSPWVLGVEGSYSGTKLRSTQQSPFFSEDRYTATMNGLGTVMGRLAYNYGRWLPFLSGGWSYANTTLTLRDTAGNVKAKTEPWSNGWVVGGGFDYRISQQIAFGIAYDYSSITLQQQIMQCPNCGTGVGLGTPKVKGDFTTQTVLARFSYLFTQ